MLYLGSHNQIMLEPNSELWWLPAQILSSFSLLPPKPVVFGR